jgi:hypothetical protein
LIARAFPEDDARALASVQCRGTFEAHMTVDAGPERREAFAMLCERIGVKCVLIELAAGRSPSQPMTAAYHRGDLATVLGEIERHYVGLVEGGFSVVRVKIEAVATNAGVPVTDDEATAFPDAYFEFHAKLRLPKTDDNVGLESLLDLCVRHGAHLSRNDRKVDVSRPACGGSATTTARSLVELATRDRFVTLRVKKSGRTRATAAFESLLDSLKTAAFAVVGVKREFTVYDSQANLDAGWLEPESRAH